MGWVEFLAIDDHRKLLSLGSLIHNYKLTNIEFEHVSATKDYTFAALDTQGNVWIGNFYGIDSYPNILKVHLDNEIVSISNGYYCVACVDKNDFLWMIDYKSSNDEPKIKPLKLIKNHKYISTGLNGVYVLHENGDLNYFSYHHPKTFVAEIPKIKFSSISVGYGFIVALDLDGNLWGKGDNLYGQLGLKEHMAEMKFRNFGSENKYCSLSCGYHHTVAIDTQGFIWGTGRNSDGELGLGHNDNIEIMCTIDSAPNCNIKSLSCYNTNTFILDNDGFLWVTGKNEFKNLIGNKDDTLNLFHKINHDLSIYSLMNSVPLPKKYIKSARSYI